MAISTKDYEAFVERFEKTYGVHPNAVDQSNLAFELKQSRRFKFPDVEVRAQGAPRKLIIPIEDAEFIRKAFNEVLGAFRKVDRMYRRESAGDNTWQDEGLCALCRKSLKGTPMDDVVDAFKYDIDGDLDYIELMHRKCAKGKNYRIDADGHLVGKGPRKSIEEAKDVSAEKIEVIEKHDLRYEQSLGSGEKWIDPQRRPFMWYEQMFGDKWRPIGGWVFPLETYRDAQNRYRAQGIGLREAVCTGCMGTGIYKHQGDAREYQCPYCKGSGESPYPVKEDIKRVAGRFQVTDKKGQPVGDSHGSYSAAQKAEQNPQSKRMLYNTADAAPGDARVAEGRTLATFGQFVTETIIKHGSGWRLVSGKGSNLGDFSTKAAAHKHEAEVEYFKKHKK